MGHRGVVLLAVCGVVTYVSMASSKEKEIHRARVDGMERDVDAGPKTFACGKVRCRPDQVCCDDGAPEDAKCVAYDPSNPDFCPLTWRGCDSRTGEPCVAPQKCKHGPPPQTNLRCAP